MRLSAYSSICTLKEARTNPGLVFDNPQEIRKGEAQFPVEQEQAGTYEFQCARLCGIHHGRVKRKWIVEA